jgi:cytoskeletal protein RodZ
MHSSIIIFSFYLLKVVVIFKVINIKKMKIYNITFFFYEKNITLLFLRATGDIKIKSVRDNVLSSKYSSSTDLNYHINNSNSVM